MHACAKKNAFVFHQEFIRLDVELNVSFKPCITGKGGELSPGLKKRETLRALLLSYFLVTGTVFKYFEPCFFH